MAKITKSSYYNPYAEVRTKCASKHWWQLSLGSPFEALAFAKAPQGEDGGY